MRNDWAIAWVGVILGMTTFAGGRISLEHRPHPAQERSQNFKREVTKLVEQFGTSSENYLVAMAKINRWKSSPGGLREKKLSVEEAMELEAGVAEAQTEAFAIEKRLRKVLGEAVDKKIYSQSVCDLLADLRSRSIDDSKYRESGLLAPNAGKKGPTFSASTFAGYQQKMCPNLADLINNAAGPNLSAIAGGRGHPSRDEGEQGQASRPNRTPGFSEAKR